MAKRLYSGMNVESKMSCDNCKYAIKAFLAANRNDIVLDKVGVICLDCETIYSVKGTKMPNHFEERYTDARPLKNG